MAKSDKGEKLRPLRRRIVIDKADRYHRLSIDPAGELARVRKRVEAKGVSVIDFTRIHSDIPLPGGPIERGDRDSTAEIRTAIATRLRKERGIRLDPEAEILPLPHLPDGIHLLTLAFVNPSDVVLYPDPGDPAYRLATIVAGGWPVSYPVPAGRIDMPDFQRIEPEAAFRARLLFAGSPGLPTGSVAAEERIESLARFAQEKNILVAQDLSLAGAVHGEKRPVGLLDLPGGRELGVEFHLLAPFHDAGGWLPGFAVGNREVLYAMETLRRRLGGPPPGAVCEPVRRALALDERDFREAADLFRARITIAVEGLREIDWEAEEPASGFHLWIPVPHGYHSVRFTSLLLRKSGIAVIPGAAFGEFGEDHVLISLTRDESSIRIAIDRLQRLMLAQGRLRNWIRQRRRRAK